MTYQVQVLKAGEADVRGPEVYWMSAWEDWETLYFYMLVIRGQGKTVVVNSGPPRDLTARPGPPPAHATPSGSRIHGQEPEVGLAGWEALGSLNRLIEFHGGRADDAPTGDRDKHGGATH